MGVEKLLHLADEPRLQFVLVLQAFFLDSGLAIGAFLPVFFCHLVAADVNVFVGEQRNHFFIHVLAKLKCRILARAYGRREQRAPPRFVEARHAFIIAHGSQHVPRHINFGHHVDASAASVRHHLFHLLLSVEAAILLFAVHLTIAVGRQQQVVVMPSLGTSKTNLVLIVVSAPRTFLGEQRISLDFDAPTLVVGQVPMHLVELICCKHVDERLQFVDSEKMARHVDVHSTPVV